MNRRRRRISSPKPATWARNGTPTPTEKSNNWHRSKDTVVVREPRPRSDWSEKPRRKQGRVETSRIDGTKTAQVRNGAEGIDLAAFPKFALAREDRWDAYIRRGVRACFRKIDPRWTSARPLLSYRCMYAVAASCCASQCSTDLGRLSGMPVARKQKYTPRVG